MTHSESKQQGMIKTWCYERGIRFAALLNSTWTSSWAEINKNKLLGCSKGLPDFLCIIPAKYRRDGQGHLIFCELKTLKGKPSKEQVAWIEDLQECGGVSACIAYGADDAISYIKSFIEQEPPKPTETPSEEYINNL